MHQSQLILTLPRFEPRYSHSLYFHKLLERDNTKTTHTKNLQKLMIEVYKSFNHLNPEYMWEFFSKKDVQYNLRTKELCTLPSVCSQRYGLNSLSFRGSLLWNTIDDQIKLSPSLEKFKRKYVARMALAVHVVFAINLALFTFN